MEKIKSFFYSKGQFSVFRATLLLIFLLGLLLRIIGVSPGYPQTHPDEPVMYATSINMVINNTLNPFLFPIYKFYYPGLTIYLYAILFKLVFIPISWGLRILSNQSTLLVDIVGPGFINAMFWSRYITAVLTSLSVPLVYFIGKQMFNKYVGLIAALFLALNYRHALSSHFSLTDGPNSTFALLVLYIALLTYKNPTLKNYLLLGSSVGLSLSTKLHFYSTLTLLFVQILFIKKKIGLKLMLKELFNIKFILAVVCVFIVFLLLNPYLPFYLTTAKKTIDYYNLRIGLFYPPFELTFPSFWYLYEIGFGKIMSLLFLLGTILIIKNKKLWVNGIFLSFFIVFPSIILLYLSHGGAYVRYFAGITPFACIVAALAFYIIFEKTWNSFVKRKKYFFPLLIFFALIVNFDQIKNSVVLDYYATKPWNYECIKDWMSKNIEDNSIVAVNSLVPRIEKKGVMYTDFDNAENYKSSFTLGKLQEDKINYAVLDIEYLRGRFNWWLSSSGLYWGVPSDILDNSLDGLVLKELSRYAVATCIKPWQSPGNNYIAIKIPKVEQAKNLALIYLHDFKKETGKVWKLSNPFNAQVGENVTVAQSSECLSGYCLKVEGKSYAPSREKIIISRLIPIKAGEKYYAKAMVKSSGQIDGNDRDGFVRIDFYGDIHADNVKRGTIASVSSRYYGDGSWKELSTSSVAPSKAKYVQVSFQVERYNRTFFIDNVRLYRSEEKVLPEEINAANRKEIDNKILYPLYLL